MLARPRVLDMSGTHNIMLTTPTQLDKIALFPLFRYTRIYCCCDCVIHVYIISIHMCTAADKKTGGDAGCFSGKLV